MTKKKTDVSVGIIKNHQTREVLLAWRDASKHQGNCYEFPGGKVELNETPRDALIRELYEELGIQVRYAKKITTLTYEYPKKTVVLHVFFVNYFTGKPHGAEGQTVKWVSVNCLPELDFPAANVPLVRMARLEQTYHITYDVASFQMAAFDDAKIALNRWLAFYTGKLPERAVCYVRDKSLDEHQYAKLLKSLQVRRADVHLVAVGENSLFQSTVFDDLDVKISGYHLSHTDLMACQQLKRKDNDTWVIAACHDIESIKRANELGVDAITLSPVHSSQTHPKSPSLGWECFFKLAEQANIPVYALGGMQPKNMRDIEQTDIFGLAGIRHFL